MPKISPIRAKFCGRNMPYTGIFRKSLNLKALRVVFVVRNHRFRSFCGSKCGLHGHISRAKQTVNGQ